MTPIQPEVIPTKGTGKYFNLLALNFPMNPSSVTFYWQLFTEIQNEEEQNIPGTCILDGNLTMDQETYAQWGTDDEYPVNWALDQLGFTKA
jgi:hypothetical protein